MSKVSETDEEDKCVDRTEGMSDDDAESVDEPKSANDRRTDNADADSSLDRLSLPLKNVRSYENKPAGVFVSGFDPTSAEYAAKQEQRAKRFGEVSVNQSVVNAETLNNLYDGLGVSQSDAESDASGVRLNVIHIHGVNEMSTQNVFDYFAEFAPSALEWIDDSSCNVVWFDQVSAARAMLKLSRAVDDADFHQFTASSSSSASAASNNGQDGEDNASNKDQHSTDADATADSDKAGDKDDDDDDLNLLNEDDVAKLGLMTVTLQQQKDLLSSAARLPRQQSDDAVVAMDVDDDDDDDDDADSYHRRRRQRDTATVATTTTTTTTTTITTTTTATTTGDASTESIPWPADAADGTATSHRWRIGHSCARARWLFLRFARASDVKKPGAGRYSQYYRKYGNPNFGGMKGIISQSKRRQLLGRRQRNQVTSAADDDNVDEAENEAEPDRVSPSREAGEASAGDDDDVDNDDEDVQVTINKRPRMRMYADDVMPHQHATTRLGRASVWQRLARDDDDAADSYHSRFSSDADAATDLRTRLDRKRRRR